MALLELTHASAEDAKRFDCKTCPKATQTLRRCRTDREDYTYKDSPIFPITITKGTAGYGFCPGKATWDMELAQLFRLLVVSFEMKQLPEQGGLYNQSASFIDLLGWFAPAYDNVKWHSRMLALFGDGSAAKRKVVTNGVQQRRSQNKDISRS